jgi:hypothetical protein
MQQRSKLIALVFFCMGLLQLSVVANPLDNWNWRYPVPQGNSLYGVAFGAGQYVAVGHFGTIITSPDGVTWAERDSGTLATLNAVTFGNGLFIAVGDFGTILTSTDGTTWWPVSNPDFSTLSSVTWGNGLYVIVGERGTIGSSPNGSNWTTTKSGNFALEDVAVGNGIFVVVGGTYPTNNLYSDGESIVLTSTNAQDWLTRTSSLPSHAYSIGFAQETFVAVTGNSRDFMGPASISTSTDGEEWQRTWTAGEPYSFYVTDVAYGAGRFVTVARGPINAYSSDAKAWTINNYGQPPLELNAVSWGPAGFVAVGPYGATARSQDGITWTDSVASLPGNLLNVDALEYGNGVFVAFTEHSATDYYSVIWRSEGGISWERRMGPSGRLSSLHFGNALFVALQDGVLIASMNGIDWTSRDTGPLSAVVYCNGLWVASPCNGSLVTSTDTISWNIQPFTSGCLQNIQFGNGRYVALLDTGSVVVSTNFRNWLASTNSAFRSVTFGRGVFVGVTFAGEIWVSADGLAWSRRLALPPPEISLFSTKASAFFDVVFGGGTFVAVGGDVEVGGVYGDKTFSGHIFTSQNGIVWTQRPVYFNDALKHVAYGNGSFVVVGYRSEVFLQCGPFPALSAEHQRGHSKSTKLRDRD